MPATEWLVGGGELAELIRSFDWSATPLGPRNRWPASLRAVVHVLVSSRFPMALLWGRELIFIYNDAYRDIAGERHPRALGHSTREIWPEVWHINGPIFAAVMERGETLYFEDKLFPIDRRGVREDAYFTLCYSPVRVEDGSVGGALVTLQETTAQVVDRTRREEALREALHAADVGRRRLQAVLDALPAGVAIADETGNITMSNEALKRIWGAPPTTRSTGEYGAWRGWWADTGEPVAATDWAMARALATGETVTGDVVEIERFDGAGRATIINAASPIRNARGEIVGGVVAEVDITAERRAEAALRESESRFRELADNAPVIMWMTNANGGIEFVNRAYREFFGATLEQVRGPEWQPLVHPDDHASYVAAFLEAVREHRPFRAAGRVRRHDGEWRWVDSYGDPRFSASGEFLGHVGLSPDITDGKLAEQRLRESERTQRLLAETGELGSRLQGLGDLVERIGEAIAQEFRVSRCGFSRVDLDRATVTVLKDFHGDLPSIAGEYPIADYMEHWQEDGLAGRVAAIDDVATHPRTAALFERAFAPIQVRAHLTVPLHRAGKWVANLWASHHEPRVWTSSEVQSMKLIAERVWAFVERMRAEETVRESEERLRIALDAASFGTFDFDPVAGRASWDAQMKRIWGFRPDEEIDHARALDRVHAADRERLGARFSAALAPGSNGSYDADFRIVWPDGSVHWCAAQGRVYFEGEGDDRRAVRVAGVERDVTSAKLAEEALRKANDALREADRRKNEFLGMLSHELRNPLAPIRNSLYVLDRTPPTSEQARRAREVAARQVAHLTRLVDDLLDVTRIARNKIELRREDVDVAELVRRTAEDHVTLMKERDLELRVEVPIAAARVHGDETRLAQVIGNLLQNAAKFTPAGGRVTVSVEPTDREVEIRVHDTGAGIEPGLLAQVFEPFVQAKQSMARTEGGLGLGLSLVKGVVELHGGSVTAASEGPGLGTEVSVKLPLARRAAGAAAEQYARDAAAQSRRRVLVVDDNRDAAESLADMVQVFGHEAEVAFDGPSAIAKVRASPPHVVLCDIGLPGMTGYEVAQTLRSQHNGMKLYAVSGYALPDDVRKAVEAGFHGHVAKPVNPVEIQRLLEP